jgi:TolB-like protein/Tfp pilus assembly protein PilF
MLSRFWKELKRRRVVHVITLYASASFVIIELINNLSDPLNLPPALATIVIVILAVGFPLAIILSWIYDLTGEGIIRTPALEELDGNAEEVKPAVHNAWKIATYLSFVVIVVLLTLNIFGGGKNLRSGDIQSILILPLENLTGDDNLDNMVSSMHTLLITDIGRIGELRILGKVTANKYSNSNMTAVEIAADAGVDAVMEGAVMCLGDEICVQFNLLATLEEEQQLWTAEYREDKSQMLNLYDNITRQVALESLVSLTPEEELRLSRDRTVDREALDAFLLANFYKDDMSRESLSHAREYLERAIEEDPDWAPLYSALVGVLGSLVQLGYENSETTGSLIMENLQKALELDPNQASIHWTLAGISFLREWNWDKAEEEFQLAIAANPSDALVRGLYAQFLACMQRYDDAALQNQIALELDPLNSLIRAWHAAVLAQIGYHEKGLKAAESLLADEPDNKLAASLVELAAFLVGDRQRSFEASMLFAEYSEEERNAIESIYSNEGFSAATREIIRIAEEKAKNGYMLPIDMAFRYLLVDEHEKALDWLEKGYEVRDQSMPYITTDIYFTWPLFDHPRFVTLLEKMNLPPPANP